MPMGPSGPLPPLHACFYGPETLSLSYKSLSVYGRDISFSPPISFVAPVPEIVAVSGSSTNPDAEGALGDVVATQNYVHL